VNDQTDQSNELAHIRDAVQLLNSGSKDMVLTQKHADVVRVALIEFDHEWRGDHWWTPFGEFRTLGELRKIADRVLSGDWPKS